MDNPEETTSGSVNTEEKSVNSEEKICSSFNTEEESVSSSNKTEEKTSDNYKTEEKTSDNYKTEEITSDNYKTEEKTSDDYKTEEITSDNYKTEDETSDNYKIEEKTSDNDKTEDETSDNYKTEEKTSDNYKIEEKTSDNDKTEDETSDNYKTEEKTSDNDKTEDKTSDNYKTEQKTSVSYNTKEKTSDSYNTEGETSNNNSNENRNDNSNTQERSANITAPIDNDLYCRAYGFKLSEDQLRSLTFPRPWQSSPGKAKLYNIFNSFNTVIPEPGKRKCRRCKSMYETQKDGRPTSYSQCLYHVFKLSKGTKPKYYCCGGRSYSRPCKSAPQHVTQDIDPNELQGFLFTQTNLLPKPSIYALDTEMIFTTAGMEVAAISIVDHNCQLVYETVVLPDSPIIDYNTASSELTKEHFKGVTTRLQDVHSKLLTLVGSRTILVGHGLENDLLRLKVVHDNIVDTIVLYPHQRGLPFRNSLAYLMDSYLEDSPMPSSGLKCRRDSVATMKLVLRKCGRSVYSDSNLHLLLNL